LSEYKGLFWMKNPMIWSIWMDVQFYNCTIVTKVVVNLKGW
jgi:hypothetical protein